MAEKRMFTIKVIDSDEFTEMPLSTQALYFHLNMQADDDGFVNNPRKIQRGIGASGDDLKLLIAKRFVLAFDNGIVAIKHWRMHNTLRKDRYKPTQYAEQMAQLVIKDNGAYTENSAATNWQPTGNQLATQYRLDKIREEENREGENRETRAREDAPLLYGEYKNVILSDSEIEKLKAEFPEDWESRIEKLSSYIASTGKKYSNHLATIKSWAKRDAEKQSEKPKSSGTCSNPFLAAMRKDGTQ